MNTFSALTLPKTMLDNLDRLGFKTMTPVQAQSLPIILQNKDVIAQAKTGSGKTAAFGIGLLTKLELKKFKPQSLILCPTRELADQVAEACRDLACFQQNIKILTLCGGMPSWPQESALKHGVHIIVGTPGRVLKHIKKNILSLEDIDTLVLDEADRMLDMGFSDEIDEIIHYVPEQRQTLLFSATFPKEILKLSRNIQTEATNIQIADEAAHTQITEYFYEMDDSDKLNTLTKLFAHYQVKNALIFSNTKVQAQEIADNLNHQGINALSLHGDLEQYERTEVMIQFANHSCAVLVATDVAARGLDVKDLEMVVNYDMPHDEIIYTHRIGRTGRADQKGIAVSLHNGYQAAMYKDNSQCHFENTRDLRHIELCLSAPNRTLIIKGGKKDKIRRGDILGALTGKTGIEGKYIGKIDNQDRQSYVAIEQSMVREAIEQLKRGKIKGRKYPVWILK
jgi:ATP-independent RNA helicase DbpA